MSSSVSDRPSCKYGGLSLIPRSVKGLDRTVARFVPSESFHVQVVHLMIEIERRGMTLRALGLAEEQLFAAQFALGGSIANKLTGRHIEFRRRREIEHVLHLRHVADLDAIQNIHAFLDRMDLVAIEVRRALFELREVFNRAQTALRSVDLLVHHASQAHRIQPKSPFLRPMSGVRWNWPVVWPLT